MKIVSTTRRIFLSTFWNIRFLKNLIAIMHVLSLYMIMIRNDKFFGNNWRNIIIAEYTTGIIISEKGDLDYRIPHVYPTG